MYFASGQKVSLNRFCSFFLQAMDKVFLRLAELFNDINNILANNVFTGTSHL
jgi:hypothetical protein